MVACTNLCANPQKEKDAAADEKGPQPQGAVLVMGCDGVWDVLSDEEAASIARREQDAVMAAVRVRDHAYYEKSADDISALVVKFF